MKIKPVMLVNWIFFNSKILWSIPCTMKFCAPNGHYFHLFSFWGIRMQTHHIKFYLLANTPRNDVISWILELPISHLDLNFEWMMSWWYLLISNKTSSDDVCYLRIKVLLIIDNAMNLFVMKIKMTWLLFLPSNTSLLHNLIRACFRVSKPCKFEQQLM